MDACKSMAKGASLATSRHLDCLDYMSDKVVSKTVTTRFAGWLQLALFAAYCLSLSVPALHEGPLFSHPVSTAHEGD